MYVLTGTKTSAVYAIGVPLEYRCPFEGGRATQDDIKAMLAEAEAMFSSLVSGPDVLPEEAEQVRQGNSLAFGQMSKGKDTEFSLSEAKPYTVDKSAA